MTNSESLHLSLIEGSFSAEEAKEILLKIYHTKLNFHQRNNLSSLERFAKNNATADLRIPVLEKSIEEINYKNQF
jgi:DNA-directed RNA polymerase subunit F